MEKKVSRLFEVLGKESSKIVQRYLPDAFIFALLLTFATMVLAFLFTDNGALEIASHWGDGFWYVLKFSMQSSLALMTGWILADSPPIKKALRIFAKIPKNQRQAVFLTAVIGQLLGLFHWGVVLIGSAIFARSIGIEMEKKGVSVHYPLLVAAAYAGLLPWHQGLSAAAPLLVATEGHFLVDLIGVIPVSQTIFHIANVISAIGLVVVTVTILPMMSPSDEDEIKTVPEPKLEKQLEDSNKTKEREKESLFKNFILDTRIFTLITSLIIAIYLGYLFVTNPFMEVFNLNLFIAIMFCLGLLFHGKLRSYLYVLQKAVGGASQIIIQFQFYGGIMGLIAWSGLGELIAQTAANLATGTTWYFFAFLAAGLVNFFVPSGGGQWVVIGRVLSQATKSIPGADMNLLMIAFGMGDQWTNMIQPFWAIPVISIAGLSIRDMMGYTVVLFVFSGILMGISTILMGVLF